MRPAILWLSCVIIISLCTTDLTSAQTGSIEGLLHDASTGKPLASARVSIHGLTIKTTTDRNGWFLLVKVPYGEQVLVAEMPGYDAGEINLSLGSPVMQAGHISLNFADDIADRQTLVYQRRNRSQVIANQLVSPVVGSALASSEMQQNGDYNVERAMARMPGVQVGRFGELNILGAGRNRYGIVMDGLPLAATDYSGRSMDLGIIPSDLISHVQLISARTPDMDATGIGGVIQLNSWQPVGNREIDANMGGMALSEYSILNGLGRVANVKYAEKFSEKFSMAAQLSHQLEVSGFESLGIGYGVADFGAGFVDVIDRLSPGLSGVNRSRYAGRLQFSYHPDTRTRYFITGMSGADNNDYERHRSISDTKGDWINQTTTGSIGQRGMYVYNPNLNRAGVTYNVVQAGGERMFNNTLLKISLGWSNSNRDINAYDFMYARDRLNYSADMDNRLRPGLTITNIPLMGDGSVDQRAMNFDRVDRLRNQQFENRYSARAGVDVPFGPLKVKLGTSLLYTQSERRYEEATLSTLRRYNLIRFQKIPRSSFNVYDRYYFPDLIDTRLAARYVDTSRPDMRLSEDDMFRRSLIRNYETDEFILGGYFMAIATIGSLDVAGGVRGELTRADYTGRSVQFNQFRFFDSTVNTTTSVDYLNLLPYGRITYSPAYHTNIRLAISKSLERQGHEVLAPFILIIPADTLRFKGNPDLKPVVADNVDLGIDHFISGNGIVSLGLFYKRMTNFVKFTEQVVNEMEFPFLQPVAEGGLNVNERSYENTDTNIELMGVTVSWQQHLGFMPGLFRNLSFNTNYTWSYSDKKDKRNPGDIYLQHHSPHVVNAALMYSQNRIAAQVAWHWSAPSLYMKATELQWAPDINRNNPVYLDQYEDGWMDLSVYFGFRISDSFRFWANAQNLLTNDRALYGDSPDAYVFDSIRRNGLKVSAGIRFTY